MLYPVLLDADGNPEAILEKVFDFQVQDQLLTTDAGQEVFQFKLPKGDPKAALLDNERILRIAGRDFRVRVIERGRDDKGFGYVQVQGEALWYDLGTEPPVEARVWTDTPASQVMQEILTGTSWVVGQVDPMLRQPADFTLDQASTPLAALRQIPAVYGGELYFDTATRTVSLFQQVGRDRGDVLFALGKNIQKIALREDTRGLVTRLFAYGASDLTFASVNEGVPYIEDYSYFDQRGLPRLVRSGIFRDDRITNPYYLLTRAKQVLALESQPVRTYIVAVLADVPDLGLGDRVWVYDPEFDLREKFRISQRNWYPLEPWRTQLQLDQPLPTLAQALAAQPQPAAAMGLAGAVTEQQMQDFAPLNYLMNSRAEQGLAYWQAMGFTVEAGRGVTGSAAFRADAVAGQREELKQIVYPSNRPSYVLSMETDLSQLQVQPGGRVGVEITWHFKDGTTKTEFYPITG